MKKKDESFGKRGVRYSTLPGGDYDSDDSNSWDKGSMNLIHNKIKTQNDNLDELERSASRIGKLLLVPHSQTVEWFLTNDFADSFFIVSIGDISLNISKEIDLQNRMLSNLEVDMEAGQQKVSMLTQKTKELVKKAGGCRNFVIILALTLIFLLLLFLVLYT